MNSTGTLIYIVVLVAAFYFLVIRPQQARQRQHDTLVKSIAEGDRILTAGGVEGVVRGAEADVFLVEIAEGVVVRVAKGAVAQRVTG